MRWLTVPHIKQRQQADCLAACVAMVAEYQNEAVSYRKLLKTLRVGKYGAPCSNVTYLTKLGWDVAYYERGTLDDLARAIAADKPCVAFIQAGELSYWERPTGHAVVVVGIDDERVYLHDPVFDEYPKVVSHDEFMLAWIEFEYDYAVITV